MRNFSKTLLALFVAVLMSSFSSVTLAEAAKYPPAEIIGKMNVKINEAAALVAAGGESREDVVNLIQEAKQLSKEISANDRVDFHRQGAQNILKKAIKEAKKGDMDAVAGTLKASIIKNQQMLDAI